MKIAEAQADIRRAFVGGGPGVMVSALVWFTAALVERTQGTAVAFTVLFFGGMLIFPLSQLAARFVFRRTPVAAENPLGLVALESTIAMIGGLLAAWLFLRFHAAYVFPLAAIAVGTHYAVFKTIYGDRSYWLLGALISGLGLIDVFEVMPIPVGIVFAVGGIEMVFAVILTVRESRRSA